MNQRFSITPATAAVDNSLTDSEYRTLAVIGVFGDKNGWCWPSQSTLAEMRSVSRKTINLHIKRLIDLKYLNIHPRYDQETGAQKSNMMQIKFDFAPGVSPDVTPPVTSKTLQGVSPLGCYTPPNTQDVTHNAPINDTVNNSSALAAYEQTFGPMSSQIQAQKLADDIEEFGETAVTEAIKAADAAGARSYGWAAARLRNRKGDAVKQSAAAAIWESEVQPYMKHVKQWAELTPAAQKIIRKVGGQSRLREVREGFELDQLKREVMSYV